MSLEDKLFALVQAMLDEGWSLDDIDEVIDEAADDFFGYELVGYGTVFG